MEIGHVDGHDRYTTQIVVPSPLDGAAFCARSALSCGFHERVRLAALHGYRYVSVLTNEVVALIDDGHRLEELAAFLAGHDMRVAEVDAVHGWMPGAATPGEFGPMVSLERTVEIASALGARCINAVDLTAGEPLPVEVAAAAFAHLCDAAADKDLAVTIEFVPWTRIADLAAAAAIVETAARSNGGVMFDSWHHHRSGGTIDDLTPQVVQHIRALQLNDAPASEFDTRVAQREQRRLLPGEGDLPLPQMISLLAGLGCTATLGFEVTSTDLVDVPSDVIFDRLTHAVHRVLQRC
jgi:sugar phosphate isomerase/epimerase